MHHVPSAKPCKTQDQLTGRRAPSLSRHGQCKICSTQEPRSVGGLITPSIAPRQTQFRHEHPTKLKHPAAVLQQDRPLLTSSTSLSLVPFLNMALHPPGPGCIAGRVASSSMDPSDRQVLLLRCLPSSTSQNNISVFILCAAVRNVNCTIAA